MNGSGGRVRDQAGFSSMRGTTPEGKHDLGEWPRPAVCCSGWLGLLIVLVHVQHTVAVGLAADGMETQDQVIPEVDEQPAVVDEQIAEARTEPLGDQLRAVH